MNFFVEVLHSISGLLYTFEAGNRMYNVGNARAGVAIVLATELSVKSSSMT